MGYRDSLNKVILDYYNVLEPDYPEWLDEYINTKELLQQQYVSVTCGTTYTNLFSNNLFTFIYFKLWLIVCQSFV